MAGRASWRERAWIRSRECHQLCMLIAETGRRRGPASACVPLELVAPFLRPAPLLLAACYAGADSEGEAHCRVLALAGPSLEKLDSLPLAGRPALGLACGPGAAALAVWGDDGRLRSYSSSSGALIDDVCSPALSRRRPRTVACVPGEGLGGDFAAGCLGYRLLVGEARAEAPRVQARLDWSIFSLACSPDGRRIAVGCDGVLLLLSAGSGALLAMHHTWVPDDRGDIGMGAGILSVAYAPDGSYIAYGDTSGLVRFIAADLSKDAGPPLRACPCPAAGAACASALAFSPDGSSLAVGCTDGWVRLRGLRGDCAGTILAELRACLEGRITALAFEPPCKEEEQAPTAVGSLGL